MRVAELERRILHCRVAVEQARARASKPEENSRLPARAGETRKAPERLSVLSLGAFQQQEGEHAAYGH